jgi:very-short-patch-repair endonuclease
LETLRQTFAEIGAMTDSTTWSAAGTDASLNSYREVSSRALACRDESPQWVHFLRVRLQSTEEGLSKLTALADAKRMEPAHLVPAFRFLFYDSLARGVFAERLALSGLTGLTVTEIRKQFAKLDKEAIILYRQRAAAIIDRRQVPGGSQVGPVGSWTDLALAIHEINKQRRHIPIRQLMRRAGRALLALKPCFMMGPLSVAQYLAPGELSFDLIVMDEASQLKPEDAVGALARGGQMIIVGDPKQLPPTTFFQRAAMDAETEEDEQTRTVAEEGESILDVASTLYQPVRRLRWHYRSRHHSLIAFSNKEFYQGDLIIFPSAYHERSDLGVKYHPVGGGVFENSRNAREAAVVVDAVLDHMERRPNESLGVVTLNFEQGELIEELLDQRLRTEPFALAYQEKMNSGPEPFFVKNLENVQGDERDVMFISATYGPDARGNQYQRFGPINGVNGHRRLNVLFTRAKKRTEVFSSLDPDKIQAGPGSAWGLRALKQYLIYARSGVLDGPDDGAEQPTNDFERSVGSVLKAKGFDVVPQVGVAGFFIDLAVKHPTKAGSYLLGIECDGATYHSGRSARDRDRLREEILVNLGWKIHRVWSTDWFKSRGAECERLLKHVDEILAADPDYRREQTRQARTEALRRALLDLRDEIHREFPDSPRDKCLLRDELLEEFMFRRPGSRDGWFRLISQRLRAETDSRQVSRYLPRVLEAIAESALEG